MAKTAPTKAAARSAAPKTWPRVAPVATNPLGVRAYIYTVVTPDMAASIHYYCDLLGHDLVERGQLGAHVPTMPGAGAAGRDYALIRTSGPQVEGGVIRLLAAPAGAKANRPRPGSNILEPGFSVIECMTRSVDTAYEKLTAAGVKLISRPLYYKLRDLKPLNGAGVEPDFDIRSMAAFGPAGEMMFISTLLEMNYKPAVWKLEKEYDGFLAGVVISQDRWPVWDFYDQVFGMLPTRDTLTLDKNVNTLIGAPKGSQFQFGFMGAGLNMEWWEYRTEAPSPNPPYPTDLDRTGLAMSTFVVNDLAQIRQRAKAAGVAILGEGCLPTPEAPYQDGFYVRGGVGELIEVIGRKA